MEQIFNQLWEETKSLRPKIVFPEGLDERILLAIQSFSKEKVIQPIVIGDKKEITNKMEKMGIENTNLEIISPVKYANFNQLVDTFLKIRNEFSEESAWNLLLNPNYFGTMLVFTGEADGLVSGAVYSTGDTIRPALQILKNRKGIRKVSGAFLMTKGDSAYVFSDCAVTISPTSEELAEIAYCTAETAEFFQLKPKIAMLSFSTNGSANSPETEKVREAISILNSRYPDLIVDGEVQFDAAVNADIAMKKKFKSKLKGQANVLIFPNLEAGNIGYKIAQQFGGYEAIGPILQGLSKPVNDLSRGCSVSDVLKLTLITAKQAIRCMRN